MEASPLDIFNALTEKDSDTALWELHLPMFRGRGWHKCPLCGYTTNATNIHRNCPVAPIDPDLPSNMMLGRRTKSLPMIPCDQPADNEVIQPQAIPEWDEKKWEHNTSSQEWTDMVRQFIIKMETRGPCLKHG